MARKSAYEHLKPQIYELVEQGRKTSEICKVFPGIPTATVYVWVKEYKAGNHDIYENSRNLEEDSRMTPEVATVPAVAIIPSSTNVGPLCPVDGPTLKEELRQIRRYLWKIMRKPNRESGAVFHGANAYLKAIQIEIGLEEIADQDESANIEVEVERRIIDAQNTA